MFKLTKRFQIKTLNLNFGPQHPAAHGVLRLLLNLNNERIVKCDPHIGLLHRGSEYLATTKPYYLSLPYFDRLDYVSMLNQEHCYCLSVESIEGGNYIPNYIKKTRTILDELTRILNHLLAIACHALDVGSMSPIFWSFEERENIMEIYEWLSGARMHAAFYRPLFGNKILTVSTLNKIVSFNINLPKTLNEISNILTLNKIWKTRLVNIGLVGKKDIMTYGLSGVFARASGLKTDVRVLKNGKYSYYKYIKFNSFLSNQGDSYSRFNLRMYEMLESTNIMNSMLFSYNTNVNTNLVNILYKQMEGVINSFKLWSGTNKTNKNSKSVCIESPKGIFGVTLNLIGNTKPQLLKVRSPSYNNLYWLKKSANNLLLADLITLIGTIDIVFGEIDR